jgi:hypothetical protein
MDKDTRRSSLLGSGHRGTLEQRGPRSAAYTQRMSPREFRRPPCVLNVIMGGWVMMMMMMIMVMLIRALQRRELVGGLGSGMTASPAVCSYPDPAVF